MSYYNSKDTSRFSFGISRNLTSKKAGSNLFTIATRPAQDQKYAMGTTQIAMTVKEAKALQSFLNSSLDDSASVDV